MKKPDKYIWLFAAFAGVILWQALMPGYVLNLDMIFTPDMPVMSNPDGFLASLPVGYLISWLCLVFPAWLVQKAMLFILFFIIGYVAYGYLPVGENKKIRLFSALLYLSNSFVYGRFLAGHWSHLMAYGFLPLFLHHLFALREKSDWRACAKLFGALFLVSIFSIHFFVMSALMCFGWIFYLLIDKAVKKRYADLRGFIINLLIAGVAFLIVSAYWLVPAFSRSAPVEGRFDAGHWQAFSAGGYKSIGTFLNTASLNGFWGERNPWARYFLWPQDYAIFWVACAVVLALALFGLWYGLKNPKIRPWAAFLAVAGVLSLIFSTGAGETVFKPVNIWLYGHMPFWSGFRDSQKFCGYLSLSYAIFAGLGLGGALDFIEKKKPGWRDAFLSVIFLVPIFFGFLVWGGFHGQIKPVWYPGSWQKAREILQSDASGSQALFLPWHGYLSLEFNHNLITANPAGRFFGERAVVSKSVEVGSIYNQEKNRDYLALDSVVRDETGLSADEVIDYLAKNNIRYIVHFQDLKAVDNLQYDFLNSARLKPVLTDKTLIMYEIGDK
jgi:hypothetical protein